MERQTRTTWLFSKKEIAHIAYAMSFLKQSGDLSEKSEINGFPPFSNEELNTFCDRLNISIGRTTSPGSNG